MQENKATGTPTRLHSRDAKSDCFQNTISVCLKGALILPKMLFLCVNVLLESLLDFVPSCLSPKEALAPVVVKVSMSAKAVMLV